MPTTSELLQTFDDSETADRHHESETIASRYQLDLRRRGSAATKSPDYVATLPKSMVEKLRLRPEEIEEILFHFAATASIPKTIEASGYGRSKVLAVVYSPENQPILESLRAAMRISIIRKIEETQLILLDAIQTPSKLEEASINQISAVLTQVSEIATHLSSASGGSPVDIDPTSVFSGDELEYMAFLRRRLSPSAPSAPPVDQGPEMSASPSALAGPLDDSNEWLSHDLVDPSFSVTTSDFVDITDDQPENEDKPP